MKTLVFLPCISAIWSIKALNELPKNWNILLWFSTKGNSCEETCLGALPSKKIYVSTLYNYMFCIETTILHSGEVVTTWSCCFLCLLLYKELLNFLKCRSIDLNVFLLSKRDCRNFTLGNLSYSNHFLSFFFLLC